MKRQYASIDIARYVSALLVVCIHTFPFLEISETFNTYFIRTVCRLAVPFFFTTSGFFFFRNYDSENEDLNETRLKKALIRLFRIYLIWTILYLPYTIFDYTHTGFHIKYLLTYVRDFFLNGSYYHLWFLPALMLADVIVYCLYKKKGLNFTLLITLILYFVGYLINVYTPIWESIPGVSFFFGFFTKTLSTARNGIFFGPMFIAIGLLLSRTRRLPKKVSLIGFLISFVLFFAEVSLYRHFGILRDLTSMYICLVPAIYFLVNYLLKINIPYRKMFTILRHDSLMIYTSHILFAKIFLALMPHAHLVVYFLTLACAQCLAGFVTRYQDQYPILKKLL